MIDCPLCFNPTEPYFADRLRSYEHCSHCDLVSVPSRWHLDEAAERSYYDLHQNGPDDLGYRRFLSRLVVPLADRLDRGMTGLDFGCGPGPTLSVMMEEMGMRMENYDIHYQPDCTVLTQTYDFVTCTEVVEHFHEPAVDWLRLTSLVRPGGWLGVMTKLVISQERFATWHYKDDPTHVCFYSEQTFVWLERHFGMRLERMDNDVLLMLRQ